MLEHAERHRVLVVDDDPITLDVLVTYLTSADFEVVQAEDGDAAKNILAADQNFDVVLTDRRMPGMDGMALLKHIKSHRNLQHIPVIMETAASQEQEIQEGINAGAYYYLTKPFTPELVTSITRAAVGDVDRYRRLQTQIKDAAHAIALLDQGHFAIREVKEAKQLAALLANACPRPESTVIGLSELLINAIEHGNLELNYEDKSRLMAENRWHEEIASRLASSDYCNRKAQVEFRRTSQEITIRIQDGGRGFDWRRYIKLDPSRVFDAHGRGIALAANLSFTSLEYRGCGNEVVGHIVVAPHLR